VLREIAGRNIDGAPIGHLAFGDTSTMAILKTGMHATGCKSSSPRFRYAFLLGHSCRDAHLFSHVRVSANPTSTNFFSHNFTKTRAVGGLLDRAIATHEIRDDISPEDLLRALVGMCYMHDQPCWQTAVRARRDRCREKSGSDHGMPNRPIQSGCGIRGGGRGNSI
jgi:hypothetical protein